MVLQGTIFSVFSFLPSTSVKPLMSAALPVSSEIPQMAKGANKPLVENHGKAWQQPIICLQQLVYFTDTGLWL